MTLPRFLLIAAASWAILAAVGTTGWCAFVARWRRVGPAREGRDRVERYTAVRPDGSDATWLSAWPVSGAHLIDFDAVHGLLSEEQVFPTADDAEAAVYNKLCAEIDANFRVLGDAA